MSQHEFYFFGKMDKYFIPPRANLHLSKDLFIVDLYVKCETDYVNGVKLYEAIVESKILETTQKQIETLKTEASKIIQETKKASKPAPVIIAGPSTGSTTSLTPLSITTPQISSITPPSSTISSITPLTSSTTPYTTSSITSSTDALTNTTSNNINVSQVSTLPTSSSVSGVTQLATSSLPSTKNM
jgi:hypothetical protein